MITLEELKTKLATEVDEISLLELLEITSYDLVERFYDRIEDRENYIRDQFGGDKEEDD